MISNIYAQCDDYNEFNCSNEDSCEWIDIPIETGSCSALPLSVCDLPEYGPCYSYCTNWGYYYNCTGETICTGGLYEIDNSYCQDIPYELGDVNQDSIINIQDVILVINLILNGEFDLVADINLDSTVNVLDVIQLVNIILNN